MDFEPILQKMSSQSGIEAVMFVDSEGEMIHCLGQYPKDQLHVIGAYQGIVLSAAERAGLKENRAIVTLYQQHNILTRRLKDGYFISVIFSKAHFASVHFFIEEYCCQLEREL